MLLPRTANTYPSRLSSYKAAKDTSRHMDILWLYPTASAVCGMWAVTQISRYSFPALVSLAVVPAGRVGHGSLHRMVEPPRQGTACPPAPKQL